MLDSMRQYQPTKQEFILYKQRDSLTRWSRICFALINDFRFESFHFLYVHLMRLSRFCQLGEDETTTAQDWAIHLKYLCDHGTEEDVIKPGECLFEKHWSNENTALRPWIPAPAHRHKQQPFCPLRMDQSRAPRYTAPSHGLWTQDHPQSHHSPTTLPEQTFLQIFFSYRTI